LEHTVHRVLRSTTNGTQERRRKKVERAAEREQAEHEQTEPGQAEPEQVQREWNKNVNTIILLTVN
jgi:Mg2+/citrate symporter